MRDFLKNYWVAITLVLCTTAVLTVEFLLFPVASEFFAVGYFVILLAIFILAFATDSCDDRAFTTFCVLSAITPLSQMGMLMYWYPVEIWFHVICGGLLSCMGGLYFAICVPKIKLSRQLWRSLRKQMSRDAEQFRIMHEDYLAQQKWKRTQNRKKQAKKKRYSYQGNPVTYVRSKIIRVDEEGGGYMIYLEQGNIHYYIFKHWLQRKGKKMLAAPKIGNYATLYFSGPEDSTVVACYINGRCRHKADGFEEY